MMRSFVAGLLLSILSSVSAFAQGTVIFANADTNIHGAVINAFLSAPQPTGTSLVFALYTGGVGATNASSFVQLGATTANMPAAGRFNGGNRNTGLAVGTTNVSFVVRAWDSTFGSDWTTFLLNAPADALRGESSVFYSQAGQSFDLISVATPFTTFPGMVLVPEPTTYALGALGLGLIWMAKRRRE